MILFEDIFNSVAGALGVAFKKPVTSAAGTAVTAGGAPGVYLGATSAPNVYFGSGAPTVTAPQGSLYLRTDGSSTSTRLYVNTNGATTWTNVTTAA
jgi:hypothetical protein